MRWLKYVKLVCIHMYLCLFSVSTISFLRIAQPSKFKWISSMFLCHMQLPVYTANGYYTLLHTTLGYYVYVSKLPRNIIIHYCGHIKKCKNLKCTNHPCIKWRAGWNRIHMNGYVWCFTLLYYSCNHWGILKNGHCLVKPGYLHFSIHYVSHSVWLQ